jgi:hypothetical protein
MACIFSFLVEHCISFLSVTFANIINFSQTKKSAMEKYCSLTLLATLLMSLSALSAQTYDQAQMQLQFMNHYGQVAQKGKAPRETVGSEYLYYEWEPMSVSIKDTTVAFELVKINLLNGYVEVNYQGEERVIPSIYIGKVNANTEGRNRTWMPANRFSYQNQQLRGFMEIIGKGTPSVMAHHYIYIKEPNPQANITGGHTGNRLLKVTDLYIYDENGLQPIRNKKSLRSYYSKQDKELKTYLKSEKLDLKDAYDLSRVVEYLTDKQ